ncbi:MAG TPA: JAB domain-containing protein [Anaerolineae bacterium]|nr:JAB domain-containing protein [Anaerolineae bacterium]
MATQQMAMLGGQAQQVAFYAPIYQVRLVRDGRQRITDRQVGCPADAATLLQTYLQGVDREHFAVILLDTKNQVIGINTVAMGTLDSAQVTGREVFKAAILANANSIILGHNHPSGDPQPSPSDVGVTRMLVAAGKALDIEVQDHIIIGELRHVSLKESGFM